MYFSDLETNKFLSSISSSSDILSGKPSPPFSSTPEFSKSFYNMYFNLSSEQPFVIDRIDKNVFILLMKKLRVRKLTDVKTLNIWELLSSNICPDYYLSHQQLSVTFSISLFLSTNLSKTSKPLEMWLDDNN